MIHRKKVIYLSEKSILHPLNVMSEKRRKQIGNQRVGAERDASERTAERIAAATTNKRQEEKGEIKVNLRFKRMQHMKFQCKTQQNRSM